MWVYLLTGVYTPGMMTDVVREVKEAARIREEALLSRVRALVEERSWSMSESNLKMMRDLDEMKVSVRKPIPHPYFYNSVNRNIINTVYCLFVSFF